MGKREMGKVQDELIYYIGHFKILNKIKKMVLSLAMAAAHRTGDYAVFKLQLRS